MDKYIDAIKNIFDRISNSYILNPTKKTVTVAFCAVIALICAVSGIFVISEVAGDKTSTTQADTTNSFSVTLNQNEEHPLRANLLFALEGEENNLELLGVMRLCSEDKCIKVSFVGPETYCSFNNLSGTMNDHYKNGGTTQLVWAVGELAGISIERYIIADYSSFKSLLNRIGDMNVYLEHEVICGQDAASLIIEKGPQTLVPEMMTKYFGYLCSDLERYDYEIAKTMMSYGERLFCTGDENDIEKNFSAVVSTFRTDISAQDFVSYKDALKVLADKQLLSDVILVENLSDMREPEKE